MIAMKGASVEYLQLGWLVNGSTRSRPMDWYPDFGELTKSPDAGGKRYSSLAMGETLLTRIGD